MRYNNIQVKESYQAAIVEVNEKTMYFIIHVKSPFYFISFSFARTISKYVCWFFSYCIFRYTVGGDV